MASGMGRWEAEGSIVDEALAPISQDESRELAYFIREPMLGDLLKEIAHALAAAAD